MLSHSHILHTLTDAQHCCLQAYRCFGKKLTLHAHSMPGVLLQEHKQHASDCSLQKATTTYVSKHFWLLVCVHPLTILITINYYKYPCQRIYNLMIIISSTYLAYFIWDWCRLLSKSLLFNAVYNIIHGLCSWFSWWGCDSEKYILSQFFKEFD